MKLAVVGPLLCEGKTKMVYVEDSEPVIVVSKDDLTAGDGAKHDVIEGKARLANQTTCNVFRLLQKCWVPSAFIEQVGSERFRAKRCKMVPYEVVVRREAHGSYLKRNPHLSKGHVFPQLLTEFFLKTSGKRWEDHVLPKDDPFARIASIAGVAEHGDKMELYLPDYPIRMQKPFLVLE